MEANFGTVARMEYEDTTISITVSDLNTQQTFPLHHFVIQGGPYTGPLSKFITPVYDKIERRSTYQNIQYFI